MKLFTRTIWALAVLAGMGAGELAAADSQLVTNWFTTNSAKYARVYKTTTAEGNGTTSTTWTNQALPVYSDIQVVSYSASWVYVQYSGLASHVMGPWLNPQGGVFQFWPTNQHGIRRFPRSPAVQAGTKDSTSGGYSGLFVNGVAIFNSLDGQAWDGSQIQGQAPHTQSTYYWHRNAPVAEAFNFDAALGHQPPSAVYHTHQNPLGLR
ncbi:MAG: YHYH protein, partial [Verrucomicrobiota bacterium]